MTNNKNAKRLLRKLEKYEQEAYDGAFGDEWLSDLGEGIKFYVENCVEQNKKMSINGLEKHIDGIYNGTIYGGNIKIS